MSTNLTNIKSLKIILWNAKGLKQNEPELLYLLIQNKIDVALITETHYTFSANYFFPRFQQSRPPRRNRPRGIRHFDFKPNPTLPTSKPSTTVNTSNEYPNRTKSYSNYTILSLLSSSTDNNCPSKSKTS